MTLSSSTGQDRQPGGLKVEDKGYTPAFKSLFVVVETISRSKMQIHAQFDISYSLFPESRSGCTGRGLRNHTVNNFSHKDLKLSIFYICHNTHFHSSHLSKTLVPMQHFLHNRLSSFQIQKHHVPSIGRKSFDFWGGASLYTFNSEGFRLKVCTVIRLAIPCTNHLRALPPYCVTQLPNVRTKDSTDV